MGHDHVCQAVYKLQQAAVQDETDAAFNHQPLTKMSEIN